MLDITLTSRKAPPAKPGSGAYDAKVYDLTIVAVFVFTLALVGFETFNILVKGSYRGQVIGRDFVQFWAAASLFWDARFETIYDFDAFFGYLKDLFGDQLSEHTYLYPPHSGLLLLPLSALSYLPAYLLWCCVSLGFYLWSVAWSEASRRRMVLALLAPTTLIMIGYGQSGLLAAALFLGGLRLIQRRPVLAGVLLGLLTFKPHLGFLMILALILGRQWLAIAAASATALAMIGWSLATGGLEGWALYLAQTKVAVAWIEVGEGFFTALMPSAFMAARLLGANTALAYGIQALFSALALVIVAISFARPGDWSLKVAILASGTILFSPYLHNYDMALLLGALVFLIDRPPPAALETAKRLTLLPVWALPIAVIFLNLGGLPIAPLLLAALMIMLLIWQLSPAPPGLTAAA